LVGLLGRRRLLPGLGRRPRLARRLRLLLVPTGRPGRLWCRLPPGRRSGRRPGRPTGTSTREEEDRRDQDDDEADPADDQHSKHDEHDGRTGPGAIVR
jgi:hypothetical protein